jgi:1A family penicillin-binding protein
LRDSGKTVMAERKYYRKIFGKKRKKRIALFVLALFVLAFFIAVLGLFGLFIYYAKDLPRPEKFTERSFIESTKIFDRTGEVLLYELYGEEKREIVSIGQISENIKHALVATEDAKFYTHHGLDFEGIFRAIKLNLDLKSPTFGGSTISQQLIRSTFFSTEKTIERKTREIILTLELERRYSKEQILEWYLNQIPFGPNIYGIEAASKTYFGKQSKDLSIAEAAALASMVKAPSFFYPYGQHKEDLLNRKDYVIKRMEQENYITAEQAIEAKNEELKFVEREKSIKAPHFVFYIEDYLFEKYGQDFLEQGGLKIYTSLNWEFQEIAERVVAEGAARNKTYFNAYNASLVAIEPKSGEILAMVGSKDWSGEPEGCDEKTGICKFDPKVNIATYRIGRQPGSSFKPFVYATAFQKGYSDEHIVIDEETDFGIWGGKHYIPSNYDGKFRGPVTLRDALAQSLNIPAVKVIADLAGQEDSIANAIKFGITTLTRPASFYGLSIVLGGGEVKLLDMVSAYGVFANQGLQIPPVSILRIENSNGEVVEENKKSPKRVLEAEVAILMSDILSDNEARAPMFGPYSSLYFKDYDVAAKTGTSGDYRDAWTMGYSPSIVVGVWAGNNDNSPMAARAGVAIAGPIWRAFLLEVLPKLPNLKFPEPVLNKPEQNENAEQNP